MVIDRQKQQGTMKNEDSDKECLSCNQEQHANTKISAHERHALDRCQWVLSIESTSELEYSSMNLITQQHEQATTNLFENFRSRRSVEEKNLKVMKHSSKTKLTSQKRKTDICNRDKSNVEIREQGTLNEKWKNLVRKWNTAGNVKRG